MRTYFAQLAAPLSVYDVLLGHLAWIAARLAIVVTIYLAVMAAFGVVYSPWAILALPAAVLTGIAFAAPVGAFAATQDKDSSFSTLYRFAIIPLFLFSGTFFPVSQLPAWLQVRGLRHAALPRRGAVPRPDARPGRVGRPRARGLPGRAGGVGYAAGRRTFARGWWCDAMTSTSTGTVARPAPAGRGAAHHAARLPRRPPRLAGARAQHLGVPALVDLHRLGFLRAALLPALHRRRPVPPGRAHQRRRQARPLHRVRGARACWPRPP